MRNWLLKLPLFGRVPKEDPKEVYKSYMYYIIGIWQILKDFYNIQMSVHAAIFKLKKNILFQILYKKFAFKTSKCIQIFSKWYFHSHLILCNFYDTLSNKKH